MEEAKCLYHADTYVFGEIEIPREKVIHFPDGIIGYPDLKDFTLIHNADFKEPKVFHLQSLTDGDFGMLVVDPLNITKKYVPDVLAKDIPGADDLDDENILVLVTVTVEDNGKFTANLMAPIIINTDTMTGVQAMTQNGYSTKYKASEFLEYWMNKAKEEEKADV